MGTGPQFSRSTIPKVRVGLGLVELWLVWLMVMLRVSRVRASRPSK